MVLICRILSLFQGRDLVPRAACFEGLEGRQMLAGDVLDPLPLIDDPYAVQEMTYSAPAASATAEEAQDTRITLKVPWRVDDDRPKNLTAFVSATDAEAAIPTGQVAFFTTGSMNFRSVYPLVSLPDGSGGSTPAYLLGTATLNEKGKAVLTLDMDDIPIGRHSIVAVYLGADAPISPQSTEGFPVIDAGYTGKRLIGLPTSSKTIKNTVIVNTGGKYFRIGFGRIRTRDLLTGDVHDISDTGVRLRQEEHDSDLTTAQAHFSPVDGPLRIDARAKKVTVDDDGVPRIYYEYDYRITPVTIPDSLTNVNEQFRGSISAAAPMHIVVATKLRLQTFGSSTVTNPPTIAASLVRLDGTTPLGRAEPNPAVRGGIQSASAGWKPAGSAIPSAATAASVAATPEEDELELGDKSEVTSGQLPPRRMPTGVVVFRNEDTDEKVGRATLDADGNAIFVPASRSLGWGEVNLVVFYKGDEDYKRSVVDDSAVLELTLTRTETETTLHMPKTTFSAGEQITWYAEVKTKTLELVKPTGTVRFFVDGERAAILNLGATTAVKYTLKAGTHTVYAKYSSDADNLKSYSEEYEITVEKATSWLSVFPSVYPLEFPEGEPIKMSSHVGTATWQILKPTGDVILDRTDSEGNVLEESVATGAAYEPFEFEYDFQEDEKVYFKGRYTGDANTLASASGLFVLVLRDEKVFFELP